MSETILYLVIMLLVGVSCAYGLSVSLWYVITLVVPILDARPSIWGCLQLLSNQSFCRQIASYEMGVGDRGKAH